MLKFNIAATNLFSDTVTREMLLELAEEYAGYSREAAEKLANQKLSKASKNLAGLDCPKLRTILSKKLSEDVIHGEAFKAGTFFHEFACLEPQAEAQPEPEPEAQPEPEVEPQAEAEPDPMSRAGANTRKKASSGAKKAPAFSGKTPRTGRYSIVRRPDSGSVNGDDEGKWAIWQHVWNCSSFEEYFAQAPAKSVTSKTGRVITASMEIAWALKSGWIVPEA